MQILFLVHRVPYPPNRGDRIRSFHLLKHLAARAEVSLGYLADREPEEETSRVLAGMCRRVAPGRLGRSRWLYAAGSLAAGRTATEGLFRCGRLRRTIAQWASETRFDTVVVFCSSMAQYLDVPGLAGVPVVVDLVDVDSEKWFDYAREARGPARMLFQLEGRRLRRLEASLAGRARAITLVSEAEAELYRGFQPAGNVGSSVSRCERQSVGVPALAGERRPPEGGTPTLAACTQKRKSRNVYSVPNGVDLDYFCPAPEPEPPGVPRCVFVGALDYRANVDGLAWFCREVWPAVHEHVPGAVLQIVGSNPGPAARRLADSAGVELVGPVPDVRPYLAGAVAVAPLRVARGIQNKVLEAMAMARPVIASPEALEGLQVSPGRDVLCAAAPGDWRDQLIWLLNDATQRAQLGAAARRYVETHHQWSECLKRFGEIVLGEEVASC